MSTLPGICRSALVRLAAAELSARIAPTRAVHRTNERDADWSPDGKWISFGSMRSGKKDIWIKPVASGEALQVTTDPASDIYAVWSPDGTYLAFASDRGGATNVATSRRQILSQQRTERGDIYKPCETEPMSRRAAGDPDA